MGKHIASTFDFFGVRVRALVAPRDHRDLLFFYSHHRSLADVKPEMVCHLVCPDDPRVGFFESLLAKDSRTKQMTLLTPAGETVLSHRFNGWSELASPLPPFRWSRLWSEVVTTSGAVVMIGKSVVLICGPNYVGKTATVLALCDVGASLLSDSVAVLRLSDALILPNHAPIGFRRSTLQRYRRRLRELDTRRTTNPSTGEVVLARPENLGLSLETTARRLTDIAFMYPVGNGVLAAQVGPTPALSWFGAGEPDVKHGLPESTLYIRVPSQCAAQDIAQLIREAVQC